MTGLHWTIAWGYLLARKRQTLTSFFAVSLGVTAYIVVSALVNGNELSFIEQAINVAPHIIINDDFKDVVEVQPAEIIYRDSWNSVEHTRPSFEKRGIKNAFNILKGICQEYPDILAAPILKQQVFLRHGMKEISSECLGILPSEQDKISKLSSNLVSGSFEDLNRITHGVILGIDLARKLKVHVGGNIDIVSASGGHASFQIVGLLQTGIVSIDYNNSYIVLSKAQALLNQKPIINELQLRVKDVNQAYVIARELEMRYHYPAKSWSELSANIFNIFRLQRLIIFVVVFAILFISSMGIYNMISTLVYDKYRDISILKSIGFHSKDIRIIFLLQGMIISTAGILISWALAYILIYCLGLIRVDIVGFVKTNRLILYQDIWLYLSGAATCFIVSLIATLLSIRKAVRVNPVDIIRVSL